MLFFLVKSHHLPTDGIIYLDPDINAEEASDRREDNRPQRKYISVPEGRQPPTNPTEEKKGKIDNEFLTHKINVYSLARHR